MANKTNASIIGCRLNGTTASWEKKYLSVYGLNFYQSSEGTNARRRTELVHCVGQVCMHKLGIAKSVKVKDIVAQGAVIGVDTFCGDWWQSDSHWGQVVDKARRPRRLTWYAMFRNALFLTLLRQNWSDVDRLCSWVDADLKPEALSEDFDDLTAVIYKSLAAGLRSTPMKGLATQEKKMANCQTPWVKLLFTAWKAAQKGDQEEFGGSLISSLQKYWKTGGRRPTPIDWIAIDHSIVAMGAMRLGMQLPKMTPEENAVLVISKDVGYG